MTDRRAPKQTQVRLTEEQRERLQDLAARWECPLNAAVARAVTEALDNDRFHTHRVSEQELRAIKEMRAGKKRQRVG